ncbi:MAG: hypothetical protein A3K77_00605 [Euryarchaeota archaeon RBG_13_31_8]|nr:MAG: hypothetical protein A3K77_00605 [Euryarchaeota archaeon RBG_13_31_8]
MNQEEKKLRKDVLKYLNSLQQCFAVYINPGFYNHLKGFPDIVFFYRGYGGVIELKVGNNKPTDLQLYFLQKITITNIQTIIKNIDEEIIIRAKG